MASSFCCHLLFGCVTATQAGLFRCIICTCVHIMPYSVELYSLQTVHMRVHGTACASMGPSQARHSLACIIIIIVFCLSVLFNVSHPTAGRYVRYSVPAAVFLSLYSYCARLTRCFRATETCGTTVQTDVSVAVFWARGRRREDDNILCTHNVHAQRAREVLDNGYLSSHLFTCGTFRTPVSLSTYMYSTVITVVIVLHGQVLQTVLQYLRKYMPLFCHDIL